VWSQWRVFEVFVLATDVVDLRDMGDCVVARSGISARGTSSAAEVAGELTFVLTVEDGLATHVRVFRDRADAEAALAG
jgi:hypothetical protein